MRSSMLELLSAPPAVRARKPTISGLAIGLMANSPPRDIAFIPSKLNTHDIGTGGRQIDAGMCFVDSGALRVVRRGKAKGMNIATLPGKPFRVIETGLRAGRANIAFDQALIEARSEGKISDTIRFLRFFAPSALIGIHQSPTTKSNSITARGTCIETVRRISGGGGLYFDEGQIGWELVFDRATSWGD